MLSFSFYKYVKHLFFYTMLNTILSFIKNIFSYIIKKLTFKDWLIILLTITTLFFYFGYSHYYNKSKTPTVIYNTDSLTEYKNKLKELYVSKDIYVQNISDLKKQNNELSEEVKNLKDNPIVVTKTQLKIQIDTLIAKSDTIIKQDSIYKLNWSLTEPNNYYSLNGFTKVKNDFSTFTTQINNISLQTKLTLDMVEKDNQIKIIGKTDNPYVTISNMDGVVFDPTKSTVFKKYYKQKKWSVGPMIGYGLTSDLQFKPFIGIGISYGIIQF